MREDYVDTVVIDFDGTIVDMGFPKIGKLKKGVKAALSELQKSYYVVISSSRSSRHFTQDRKYHEDMVEFLKREDIPYDEIDDGLNGKRVARWYIDDRAIPFEDNWKEICKKIKR